MASSSSSKLSSCLSFSFPFLSSLLDFPRLALPFPGVAARRLPLDALSAGSTKKHKRLLVRDGDS